MLRRPTRARRVARARWRPTGATIVACVLPLLLTAHPAGAQAPEDKALGRVASASSAAIGGAYCANSTCTADRADDGNANTHWSSDLTDRQPYWQVDLGAARSVDAVTLTWGRELYPDNFRIATSLDGAAFTEVATATGAGGGPPDERSARPQTIAFSARSARYVRVNLTPRLGPHVVWLFNAGVFGPADPAPVVASAPSATPGPAAAATSPQLLSPFPIVRVQGRLTRAGVRIHRLSVRAPRGATVEVRCRGRGCPRRSWRRSSPGFSRFRGLERTLRPGSIVEVRVTATGTIGKFTRFAIRRGRLPRRSDACIAPGASRPSRCPSR